MKRLIYFITAFCFAHPLYSQLELEFFGLDNQDLAALDINYGIMAVGTDRHGVYWQYEPAASDTSWTKIAMDSSVQAVYPHKSGPIGWAISAGIRPASALPPYIYCSQFGGEFEANSVGIDPLQTGGIQDIDGFPDETICGETFAVGDRYLYRRNFGDTIWHPVFTATVEGYLQTVKVRQFAPGVVLLGGADGFAGTLLSRSLDFGETWEDISPPGMIFGIDFAGVTADTIFAVASNKIFRTADGGSNWTTVFNDDGVHLTEIVYDLARNMIYAAGGTTFGEAVLIMSQDFGDNWASVPLTNLGTILGLESGSNNWTYFITRDEGVYRFREGTTGVEDISTGLLVTLEQNFPNPASSITYLDYTIPETTEVSMKVTTAGGLDVSTLVHERQSKGTYRIPWNVSGLCEGLYFVTLHAAGQTVTRSVMVH